MSEVLINVQLGKAGIIRSWAEVSSVANGKLSAEAFDAASLGLHLTHKALRQHFSDGFSREVRSIPFGKHDLFRCLCGEVFESGDAAIRHVEKDHASARIRRDLDKVESLIETLLTPNPLPPAPEPTFVVKDRSFGEELQAELAGLFADIGGGEGEPEARAKELINFCGWKGVKALSYVEYKVKLIDGEPNPEKKIPPRFHEDYLGAIALFLRQVGELLKLYGRTKRLDQVKES